MTGRAGGALPGVDLEGIRGFLEERWVAWGRERDRPVTRDGEGMCRFTSAFLIAALGSHWQFSGGFPEYWDFESGAMKPRASGGGYFDGEKWHAHHWVTNGRLIVDLTASQFGAERILVVPADDSRFRSTFVSRHEIQEALRDVKERATVWAREWFELQSSITEMESPQASSVLRLRG